VQKALSLFSEDSSGEEEDLILTYGGVQLLLTVFAEAQEKVEVEGPAVIGV
jgi:hypothetical protein